LDHGNRNVIAGNRSLRDVGGVLILKGRANLVTRKVVVRARINGIRLAFEEPGLGGHQQCGPPKCGQRQPRRRVRGRLT
jgi:hypothetical protein